MCKDILKVEKIEDIKWAVGGNRVEERRARGRQKETKQGKPKIRNFQTSWRGYTKACGALNGSEKKKYKVGRFYHSLDD